MSGDVTYQALERLTHMPDRADPQADRIAGQYYYDVHFTGGSISGVVILTPSIDGATITNSTIDSSVIGGSVPDAGTFTNLTALGQITSTVSTGTAPMVVASTTRVSNLNVAQAGVADTVTIADAAGDTTCFVLLAGSATGNLAVLSDSGLAYNATTNALTATTFIGALQGNADTATTATTATNVTVANEAADTTCFLLFATDATGNLPPKSNAGLTFNAATGVVGVSGVTVTGTTVPTNGVFLPAASTLGFSVNGTEEVRLTATAFSPTTDGGNSLGTTALGWQNLFGNTGFVLNIENGNWVATHTSGIFTVGTGDLRVTTAGTNTASVVTVGGTQTLTGKTYDSPVFSGVPQGIINMSADGRLTLTSGLPVTTADVTGATSIYYTPYIGNKIALYTGAIWVLYTFSELTLALGTLTSGLPYDVFLDYNSGTPQLAITAWTNDTTRATALTRQDGVYVKTGDTEQRYLGTFYTTSTTTTEDSAAKRFVWNMYNRVVREMRVIEATNSWNYSTAAWRQANGSTANQLDFVRGVSEDMVDATCVAGVTSTAAVTVLTAIGLDSTTAIASPNTLVPFIGVPSTGAPATAFAMYKGLPSAGRHFLAWLEFGGGSGTQTWYGDNGGINVQNGISGSLLA